jgi:hydroxyacylglutathione hydrolase
VLAAAKERGWHIAQVWITHWHPDHVGGVAEIRRTTGAQVTGPRAEADKIEGLDTLVDEGSVIRLSSHTAQVMRVPGHTQGHVAFHFSQDGALFTGDTLFAMGCGRLFEGTPEQMYLSLERLAGLPDDTRLYCAHEYTLANAAFAVHAEPENEAAANRLIEVKRLRDGGKMTVPTTVAQERETNPFVRATNVDEFARLRREKDSFRS